MNQTSIDPKAGEPGAPGLRFDLVAGLTAAAVVLPKAMAYATVAGLPVAVGLYTAFIPMVIYALLGTSRVLSVSSTTTLAILAGTQLGLAVPDGDHAEAHHGNGDADRAGRRDAGIGTVDEAGLCCELHFRAGTDRFQGGDRPRDRSRPGAQAPRHPHRQAGVLRRHPERRPARSRHVAADARGRGGDVRDTHRHGAAVAALAGPAGRGRRRHRRVVVLRPRCHWGSRRSA